MDRSIIYTGELPQSADVLFGQQGAMIGIGNLIEAALGTNSFVSGLAVTQNSPAAQNVLIAPGNMTALMTVEASSYGTLPTTINGDALMKMGIVLTQTTLSFPWAAITSMTTGQALNVLIQAAYADADNTSVTLPYYNSTNPLVPYSGPSNSGTPQNTRRVQTITFTAKVGAAATAGSQTTLGLDSGNVALAVITIPCGATTVLSSYITLSVATPGKNKQVLTGSGTFIVPTNIYQLRGRAIGGGGGGGASSSTTSGQTSPAAGGNSGSWADFLLAVTPGQSFSYSCGAAGAAGATPGGTGGTGGTTTFGTVTAPGGHGGIGIAAFAPPYVQPPAPPSNVASGTGVIAAGAESPGQSGASGAALNSAGGAGGSGPYGGGGGGSPGGSAGGAGLAYGAAGGGGSSDQSSSAYAGGAGHVGCVVLEY